MLQFIISKLSKFNTNNSFSIVSNLLSYSFVIPHVLFSYFKVPLKKLISEAKGISKSPKGNLYSNSDTDWLFILYDITINPLPPSLLFIPPLPTPSI